MLFCIKCHSLGLLNVARMEKPENVPVMTINYVGQVLKKYTRSGEPQKRCYVRLKANASHYQIVFTKKSTTRMMIRTFVSALHVGVILGIPDTRQ